MSEASVADGRTRIETWETMTDSVVALNLYDRRGGERSRVFGGRVGQQVQLRTDEREELNEERVIDKANDPFRNGFLRPVRNVPADVMTRFEVETKPHGGLTAEEMYEAIAERKGGDFVTWVDGLNEAALHRLEAVAKEADAQASQLEAIAAAKERFAVQLNETQADRLLKADPQIGGEPVPVGS